MARRSFLDQLNEINQMGNQKRQLDLQENNNNLDQAIKLAELKTKGIDVSEPEGPRSLFGLIPGRRNLSIAYNPPTLPAGFVRIGNQIEKDPTYESPKEKAMTEYYRGMAGNASLLSPKIIDENGMPLVKQNPQDLLQQLNPGDQAYMKGLLDYKIDPNLASKRGNQAKQLVELASQIDPNYDMTQYPVRSKYRQEFSSGKIGSLIRSFNTAMQHLSELHDTISEVPSSPIKVLEAGQRLFSKQLRGNSPESLAMQKENAALTAVNGELANIFKNSAGGTDQEIKAWRDAYDPNATREAKKAYIKQGIELMKGRIGSLDADYNRVMGKRNENSLISPESQAAIDRIYGKEGTVVLISPDGSEELEVPSSQMEHYVSRGAKIKNG
jgi:hypothetical protein